MCRTFSTCSSPFCSDPKMERLPAKWERRLNVCLLQQGAQKEWAAFAPTGEAQPNGKAETRWCLSLKFEGLDPARADPTFRLCLTESRRLRWGDARIMDRHLRMRHPRRRSQ